MGFPMMFIAERGSEQSIPIYPLHTGYGFQDTLLIMFFGFFFPD